jgi:hypothetical protein
LTTFGLSRTAKQQLREEAPSGAFFLEKPHGTD